MDDANPKDLVGQDDSPVSPPKKKRKSARLGAVYVVRVAVMAGLLTALKLALAALPNVEVVTLLILVYGSAMGLMYALPATLIFCAVEMAIHGVGSWVLLYFLYFPLLAVLAGTLLKGKRFPLAVIITILGGVLFGVLSACADTLFCVASLGPAKLAKYWVAYYVRGIYFDLVHIVSTSASVAILYVPLVRALKRATGRGE